MFLSKFIFIRTAMKKNMYHLVCLYTIKTDKWQGMSSNLLRYIKYEI